MIDPASASIVRSAPVCAGPRGMATNGTSVVVACESSGAVVSVDAESLAATELATNLVRPRAIVATYYAAARVCSAALQPGEESAPEPVIFPSGNPFAANSARGDRRAGELEEFEAGQIPDR